MKKECCKCHEKFILSNEEETMLEAGTLERLICDDCFCDEEENDFGGTPEYESYSDADCGL